MDETIVRGRVEEALKILLKNDDYLMEHDVNERSITHKLAEYLQQMFPGYHVDCEYNKDVDNPKGINTENNETSLIKITHDAIQAANGIKQPVLNLIEDNYKDLICSRTGLKNKLINLLKKEGISDEESLVRLIFENSEAIQRVFPDIIVHKRSNNNDNLLVIEVKKASRNKNKRLDSKELKNEYEPNKETETNDIDKLIAYKNEIGYKHISFIELWVNSKKSKIKYTDLINDGEKPYELYINDEVLKTLE